MSRNKPSHVSGFTLIEILIALAIIAIALTAIVKATSYGVKDIDYINNKTMANWVALNTIAEAQLRLITLPSSDKSTMLGHTWYWSATSVATPVKNQQEIIVSVRANPNGPVILRQYGFLWDANNV